MESIFKWILRIFGIIFLIPCVVCLCYLVGILEKPYTITTAKVSTINVNGEVNFEEEEKAYLGEINYFDDMFELMFTSYTSYSDAENAIWNNEHKNDEDFKEKNITNESFGIQILGNVSYENKKVCVESKNGFHSYSYYDNYLKLTNGIYFEHDKFSSKSWKSYYGEKVFNDIIVTSNDDIFMFNFKEEKYKKTWGINLGFSSSYNYERTLYSFDDLVVFIYNNVKTGNLKEGTYFIDYPLYDIFNIKIWNGEKFEKLNESSYKTKIRFKINYSNDKVKRNTQSIFGVIGNSKDYDKETPKKDLVFWKPITIYTLTFNDFDTRNSEINNGNVIFVKDEISNYLNGFKDIEINLKLDLTNLDIVGFDRNCFKDLKINKIELSSEKEIEFKLLSEFAREKQIGKITCKNVKIKSYENLDWLEVEYE